MKEAIYMPREIRNYRDSFNITQRVFGRKYNRSDKAVSTWENGRCKAPDKVLEDVLNWLNHTDVKVKNEQ